MCAVVISPEFLFLPPPSPPPPPPPLSPLGTGRVPPAIAREVATLELKMPASAKCCAAVEKYGQQVGLDWGRVASPTYLKSTTLIAHTSG